MLAHTLADYAASLRETPIPKEVHHAAKRCVVDWFAALLPGSVLPPATLLRAVSQEDLGHGQALLYPSGEKTTARSAALINGSAAHTVEFDDIYRDALYHPGAPVIAAALAAAQARRASGEALLRAVIAGYEVSTRIGVAVIPTHYEYWHTTGTVGAFGAAVAAATVLGLDPDRIAHALGNAGTLAAGLQQAFRSDAMSKPLHAGRAAESGVLVALAAEQGVTGATDILEGSRGFGAAMSKHADWEKAVEGLGEHYNIVRTTQKNHGCCGHTFAAVDAILALRQQHGLSPEDVRLIRVGSYAKALEITGNPEPRTAFEAKFSLPYCVAVALVTGRVRLEAFSPERLRDPRVRELMTRIELRIDDELEREFPRRRAALVEVETIEGKHLRHYAPTRKGDPDNPLTDEELNEKYQELAEPVIGKAAAASLLDALWRLEEIADATTLGTFPAAGAAAAR